MRAYKVVIVVFLVAFILIKAKNYYSLIKQLDWARTRIIELQEEVYDLKLISCDRLDKELNVYRQMDFNIISNLLVEVGCSDDHSSYALLFWDDAVCSSCSNEVIEGYLDRIDDSSVCNVFVLNNFDEREEMIFGKRFNLNPIRIDENMHFEYPFVVFFDKKSKQVEKITIL